MIGMSSLSFLLLLGIGVIVAAVLHFGFRYRFLEGPDAVFAKIAMAWPGAWLGSPVLGHWSYRLESAYLAPAILGSSTAVMLNVVGWKALGKVFGTRPATEKGRAGYAAGCVIGCSR